jgi:hypothetical protein
MHGTMNLKVFHLSNYFWQQFPNYEYTINIAIHVRSLQPASPKYLFSIPPVSGVDIFTKILFTFLPSFGGVNVVCILIESCVGLARQSFRTNSDFVILYCSIVWYYVLSKLDKLLCDIKIQWSLCRRFAVWGGVMSCLFSDFTLTVLGELCKSHGIHCGVDGLICVLNYVPRNVIVQGGEGLRHPWHQMSRQLYRR